MGVVCCQVRWSSLAVRAMVVLVLAGLAGQVDCADASPVRVSGPSTRDLAWWDTEARGKAGPHRIILVYNSGGIPAWTADHFRYYISHIGQDGNPDDWFFDTLLVLALAAESQRGFEPNYGSGPSLAEDWRWYLDQRLFGGYRELAELEKAVSEVGYHLNDRSHVVRVIIGIPYPDLRAGEFGNLDGRPLDFTRCEDRAAAVRWYLREVSRRWTANHFEHLRLAGFYWVREEAPEEDRPLLEKVSKLMADQLLPFYWIPYFGSQGGGRWRDLGFDVAIEQPNYFFDNSSAERIAHAAQFARQHCMGIEIELDKRVKHSEEGRSRYYRYLDGGVDHGYQHAGILAWYDDCALLACGQAQEPALRRLYDDTYRFVRGAYRRQQYASEDLTQ